MSDIVGRCKVARQALSDWAVTYAPDMCSEETVAKAKDRVLEHGTLAYIANAIDQLSAAISRIEQLECHAEDTGTLLRNSVKRISELERELASARSAADSLADKIEDMINEFGDDPKAALQCVSEWLDLRNHEKAIASRNRRLAEQEGT